MATVEPIMDRDQLERMAKYLKAHNQRDYVLFEIGINAGIRVTDFTHQQVGFYREAVETGRIKMTPSKTAKYGKTVDVPLSDGLRKLIEEYIAGRDDEEWMFPSRKGGTPLTRQQIFRILNDAAEECGVQGNIGCHSMRKTFGYWHYFYNKDIRLLMSIFNHSSEEVTLKYIGVSQENKKKSMSKMDLGI